VYLINNRPDIKPPSPFKTSPVDFNSEEKSIEYVYHPP